MSRLTWSRPASLEYFRAFEYRDFKVLFDTAHRYDALEDMPWPFVYRAMDEHFPDARFVLTRRRDSATWARSIHRQTLGKPRRRMHPYSVVFGHHFFHEGPRAFVDFYERHNRDVVAYFAAKYPDGGKLLELCFEAGDGWDKLCQFLGVPSPGIPFPHANARSRRWYKDLYLDLFFGRQRRAAERFLDGLVG